MISKMLEEVLVRASDFNEYPKNSCQYLIEIN